MQPNTDHNTADQQHLRALTDEIELTFRKHNLAGVVLLVSRESAAWKMTIPDWSYLVDMDGKGFALRMRLVKADPESTARTVDTLHLIGALRDMSRDVTELFGRLFRTARETLKEHGAELVHEPFGGVGVRLDPESGKDD